MSGTSGVPEGAAVLRTQVTSLRAANESLRALLEDKDAKTTELEAKLTRLERLIYLQVKCTSLLTYYFLASRWS